MLPVLVTVILGPQAQPNRNVTMSQLRNSKCTSDWKVMLLVCTILPEHCDLWVPISPGKLGRVVTPSTFWVLTLRFPLKQWHKIYLLLKDLLIEMIFQSIHLSRERFFRHLHPLMIVIGVKYNSWHFTVYIKIKLVGFTWRPTDSERQCSEELLLRQEFTALDKCSYWEGLTTCFIQKLRYTSTWTGKSKGQNYIRAESCLLTAITSSQTFLCHQPDQAYITLLSLRPPELSCETVAPLNSTPLPCTVDILENRNDECPERAHVKRTEGAKNGKISLGLNQGKFFML